MPSTFASVPSLTADQLSLFLLQLGILLLLALCLGRLARRLGFAPVVGELTTGILLGPSLLGWTAPDLAGWLLPARADQVHLVDAVGQFAVMLLVGITGAHVEARLIRRRGADLARISLGGLLVPLAMGITAGYLAPAALLGDATERATFAVFLGVALCVSAIPVIAKTLTDLNMLHRDVGQLTLGAASIDDAVGWLLLSVASAMATSSLRPELVALSAIYLVLYVALAAIIGRPLVRLALSVAGRSGEPGPVVATVVVIILLGAAASQALGLEAVFGAFVAGVLVGSSGGVDQVQLAPLRTVTLSVLAPLFLACAGLRIDMTALRDPTILLAGLTIFGLATLGKFVGAYAGARLSRLGHWEGLALGAALNARGVIEVVVATVGLRLGILTLATYTIVVLVAVATSVMAPPLLRWAMARVEHSPEERQREAALAGWAGPLRASARLGSRRRAT